jgi:hypothetical protein
MFILFVKGMLLCSKKKFVTFVVRKEFSSLLIKSNTYKWEGKMTVSEATCVKAWTNDANFLK